jgi:hypothetical protein
MPQPPFDSTASVLALDCQGLPAVTWPPTGEPSQGFLGAQGAPPGGANKWALDPFAHRVGGVTCPDVSCPLRDPTESY